MSGYSAPLYLADGRRVERPIPGACWSASVVRWPYRLELDIDGQKRSFALERMVGGSVRYVERPS